MIRMISRPASLLTASLLTASLLLAGVGVARAQSFTSPPGQLGAALPAPPAGQLTPALVQVSLSAVYAGDNRPVRSGLVWRVIAEKPDGKATDIIARSTDAAPAFPLEPGTYVVHAAYGFASGMRRIVVAPGKAMSDRVAIAAGGLKLSGAVGDSPIPAAKISFSIYVPLPGNSEGRLVLANARAGDLIRLPEGAYHVVSTYGDANAIQRADIKVETGKVTEATLNHRAARVTLKLVAQAGGEAFAGTAFSVLTPGGDVVRDAIGAFPQVILAEGDYMLVARQEGQIFTREFKVESGVDRDIEVLAKSN